MLPFTPRIILDVWFPAVLCTLAVSSLSLLLQYLSWKATRQNHRRECRKHDGHLKSFLLHPVSEVQTGNREMWTQLDGSCELVWKQALAAWRLVNCVPRLCWADVCLVVKAEVKYAKVGKTNKKKNNKKKWKNPFKIPCHQLPLITDFLCHPACQGWNSGHARQHKYNLPFLAGMVCSGPAPLLTLSGQQFIILALYAVQGWKQGLCSHFGFQ